MSMYDEGKYGVITRTWFGLTNKMGGQGAAALAPLSGSATTETIVTRWYPRGPIKVKKVGFRCVATASAAANATGASDRALIPINFYKSSVAGVARTTLIASDAIKIHPTAVTYCPLWTLGSKEIMASAEVEAGRFVTIFAATPLSNAGTAAEARGTTLVSGSFAFFVDWVPKYDQTKWSS